ncbi:hypothetical protein [Terriglobus sp.]|uniref:hypothetical protein n=1 Tax=Terriglobus sp. TaxID=1889013 RepID=UPI003B00A9CE
MLLPLIATYPCAAAGCAATPNAAVLQALGEEGVPRDEQSGFRVRDIVTDPVLHRAFVHVEQCGHPERPLVLLPFHAERQAQTIAGSFVPNPAAAPLRLEQAMVPSGSVVAVAMGDEHMRLTVEGRLLSSAPVGSVVDVQLASLGGPAEQGEPAKRVRGRLTAKNQVEVQP